MMTEHMEQQNTKRTRPRGSNADRVKLLGLKQIREWRRVPVAELALKLEQRGHQATTQSVYNWQHGGSALRSTAAAIAEILDCTVEQLAADAVFVLENNEK